MRAAVEGDERARVQDLGAEVGDLRRLAVVHLREQPRVGHRSRVGGQDPGHVLPQHDARRAERAGEKRRGQVGAAAAERRDGAVGARADEAGHDRGHAALQERSEEPPRVLSRGGEVGCGAAVVAVGHDDLRRRRRARPGGPRRGAPPRRPRSRRAPRGPRACRSPAGRGRRGRPSRARSPGTRGPGRRRRRAGVVAPGPRERARARGRGGGAGTWPRRRRPPRARRPRSGGRRRAARSVTPASAETTTTSGPRCARTSATA